MACSEKLFVIDGSYGEGGGQILRSALSLSALLGRPVRLEKIRARRRQPGLRPQHLTAVRALAQVCDAEVEGDTLDSRALTFVPCCPPQAGAYHFDVMDAAEGGSAGAVSLILQAVLLPLALAKGDSTIVLEGGTHVAWSPPIHYLKEVYLPTLARLGVLASVELDRWGWYPQGGGRVICRVQGLGAAAALQLGSGQAHPLVPLHRTERGGLKRITGFSATSNLPAHIGQRQRDRAVRLLRSHGFVPEIEIVDAPSPGPGTCVFLLSEFKGAVAAFTGYGRLRKPAEKVAEEAARAFLAYQRSGRAVDRYLADQLILPLALADGDSRFTTGKVTDHLCTSAWLVRQFLPVEVEIGEDRSVRVHTGLEETESY
jgi:RNA 3'-terminal phosphate cyclase (ATP)